MQQGEAPLGEDIPSQMKLDKGQICCFTLSDLKVVSKLCFFFCLLSGLNKNSNNNATASFIMKTAYITRKATGKPGLAQNTADYTDS